MGEIAEGFLLRPVATDDDVARYAEINQSVTKEGEIARRLLLHRPGSRRADFVMAVERDSGRVVSTTCLLRWRLSYDGAPLEAAMLEMVVTDPAYRRHGLVRAQVERFHEKALESGADLTIIQGIPYYYRQYGYGYALDHGPAVTLRSREVPAGSPHGELRLRPAADADIPFLATAYNAEMARQALHVTRGETAWAYLISHAGLKPDIVERRGAGEPLGSHRPLGTRRPLGSRRSLGYVCRRHGQSGLAVPESGLLEPEAAPAVLDFLSGEADGEVSIGGNAAHALAGAAIELGADAAPGGQWLIRVPDHRALLLRLAPVLEDRLRRAGLGDVSEDLVLNFYRRAARMRFVAGKLDTVEDAGFVDASMGADGGDLCIPPEAFARLLFGYRGLEQIRDAWPDTTVKPRARALVQALFPPMSSWILMPY